MSADLLPPMKWNAWGDPHEAKPLSEGIRALLTQALGVTGSSEPELEADQVRLAPSKLTAEHREALTGIVGPDYCRVDDSDRLLRAGGKSTLDLLRRKEIMALRRIGTPSWLESPDALDQVREHWDAIRPLTEWIVTHVGPAESRAADGRSRSRGR